MMKKKTTSPINAQKPSTAVKSKKGATIRKKEEKDAESKKERINK